MVKEEFDHKQGSTTNIPYQGDGQIPLTERQEEESMLQSASGDAPPFAKGICQPSGILTPNECCPNGYESILNIELCKKAVVFTGPDFDPVVQLGPHLGQRRPVPFLGTRVVAMHIEGGVRPQWSQWTMGSRKIRLKHDNGTRIPWLPTAGRGCGVWPLNHVGIFTPYDQLGTEGNGVIWPVCVISTYPKDEMPEFSIGHCRPSGKYTKNECCDYGYVEITDAGNCKRGLNQFPWNFGAASWMRGDLRPAAWAGEVEVNDYPSGCYVRNHDNARGYFHNREPLQGFLNKKATPSNMVSGHLAAIP